ncbi:MAG: ATP-NAD kinase [Clostridia bacterium]|nr:ATP-NAD kinase [Clostridia bacterium]
MGSIGIIANPASGKDIRRLVSYATTIDNNEKVNICKRIVLAAQVMGVSDFIFMPETFMIGYAVKDDLENDCALTASIGVLDFEIDASLADTVTSARMMEEAGVGCIVVLGGDGTSRAVAKGINKTPILPISTGTNNVYPAMMEGTVAGMAAAAVTQMADPASCCIRDKRIEVSVNGEFRDLALIDAVVSDDFFAGAKAIWDAERIKKIIVSRCHPATIGFSAVAGVYEIVEDTDDHGFAITLGKGGERILAPIAAGVLTSVEITEARRIPMDGHYEFTAARPCMVALDGEREIRVNEGDRVIFTLTRNGPWRVLPRKTLGEAARLGMYRNEFVKE